MKKIFTLIATALMAVSVNAKEEVSTFNPWSSSVTVEGKTFTLAGGWNGAGTNYTFGENDDKTAFDYVYIKYSGATGSPNFGIVYNEWLKTESWGESFVTITTGIPDGSGTVGIKLDKESVMQHGNAKENGQGIGDVYAKHVSGVQIQSGNAAATVTIEGVWFGTATEFAADGGDVPVRPSSGGTLTMWEGSLAFPDGWSASTTIDAKYFEVAEVGDVIRCKITPSGEPNFVFKHMDWSDYTELDGTKTYSADKTVVEATIASEDVLTYLKKNGFRIQGINFTLTSVELFVPLTYQEGKALTVSDNGNILSTEFQGYSDDAKVVFTCTVTGASGYNGWGNGKLTSIGEAVKVGEFTIKSGDTDPIDNEKSFTLNELKAALDEPGFYKDEKGDKIDTASGLAWSVWGFDEGKCTTVRKSAVIYEVTGFSGPGYQPKTTGIGVVSVGASVKASRYNLAGQKVDESYKGIVIMNGKKVVVK